MTRKAHILLLMDLVGAESRKTGTRGGRANFKWDDVRDEERSYYLGASISKPMAPRRGKYEGDWYLKPTSNDLTSSRVNQDRSVRQQRARPSTGGMEGDGEGIESEINALRRREKAIMARVASRGAGSFADAVRSALAENTGSGVDDDGDRDGVCSGAESGGDEGGGSGNGVTADGVIAQRDTKQETRLREKRDREARKEMRRRIRELRLVRRAERSRRYSGSMNAASVGNYSGVIAGSSFTGLPDCRHQSAGPEMTTSAPVTIMSGGRFANEIALHGDSDSSESLFEGSKGRPVEGRRRRRRRERDSAPRRKRSDWSSTSESDDFDRHRSRRRLR